jgi:hypothetical protein
VLEQLSDRVRECLERAADARAKADATNDPASKVEFLKMEEHWLILARSYGFSESLEDFTTANLKRRRKFDEHLRAKTGADQFPRPASTVESSADWLDDTLHQVSTLLIDGGNFDALYSCILDSATRLMSSDMPASSRSCPNGTNSGYSRGRGSIRNQRAFGNRIISIPPAPVG